MKFKNYIFTFLAFMFCLNIFAKDKLITIYDNDCSFCHSLLNETYQNESVKQQLNNYEHQLFETNSIKGMEFIQNYNIITYPTQIAIINEKAIILNGFLNTEEQIKFLKNPLYFKKHADFISYNSTLKLTSELQEKDSSFVILPKRHHRRVCAEIDRAFKTAKDPLESYLKSLRIIIERIDLKVEENEFLNFAYQNLTLINCENKDGVKMRKFNTILKYAIDSKNYEFIRNVIIIKENGKNVCNPYIDFTRKEVIDGEEETLIEFIDKILNEDGMGATYNFGTIKNIRMRVQGCIERNNKAENKKRE